MKKLRKIEIEAQHVSAITFLPEDLDKELERLKIWSKLSTSLCQVLMPLCTSHSVIHSVYFLSNVAAFPANTLWTRVEQDSDIWMPTCNKRQHMLWLSQRPEYSHLINDLSKKDTKEDEAMSSFPPQIHSRELDDEVILNTERFSDGSKVMMGPLLHVKPWIGPYGVVYVPRPQERDNFSVPDN
ncbi:hypothetical protein BDQ17DRAFT_1356923 [Cyathus striatus]|nr:hypothetical protein BDQ17DRAFT_1356923 [Cyathus striatus]